ncbi:MAG TPA: preprotein translocase subunit SecE [Candidatus Paceibacterota bacterium]|nr:preprotein translocase subunit SecE [Candidatus Paceibacterota bacterium]
MNIATYLRHVREEFKHLTWPSRQEAIAHTLMVILVSAVVAALVGALDYALTSAVSAVVGG